MTIEYLRETDNKVADALSRVETRLDPDTVKALLDHARDGLPRAESEDLRVVEDECRADEEVILRAAQLARQDKKFRNLCTENWRQAQLMDPVIPHIMEWRKLPNNNRIPLGDFLRGKVLEADRRAYCLREKDFVIRDHMLYVQTTPPGSNDTIPVFVVLVNRRQLAIDGCHQNAGHQGWDRTFSLMRERFWWTGMRTALFLVLRNCGRCKQLEAKGELPGMEPIMCTQPMELVHVDYVGKEVTASSKEKPVVKNILVVVDHFTPLQKSHSLHDGTSPV